MILIFTQMYLYDTVYIVNINNIKLIINIIILIILIYTQIYLYDTVYICIIL